MLTIHILTKSLQRSCSCAALPARSMTFSCTQFCCSSARRSSTSVPAMRSFGLEKHVALLQPCYSLLPPDQKQTVRTLPVPQAPLLKEPCVVLTQSLPPVLYTSHMGGFLHGSRETSSLHDAHRTLKY